jgi:hypothetical protein
MAGRWLIGFFALLAPLAAQAEALDNAAIVALSKAGLGAAPILAKVRQAPCGYDTSPTALIALKQASVPEPVIVAMIERCAGGGPARATAPSGQAAGIYLADGPDADARLTLLRPAAQSSTKMVGNGSILFPHIMRLIVPGPWARLVSPGPRPVFHFQFDAANRQVGGFGEVASNAAQSPSEFSLVRFRAEGGNRQVPIGRAEPYMQISGIDPKNTLPFTVTELGGGGFRVEMAQPLEPGEYGFVLLGERERRGGTLFRIYDFAVAAPAAK